MLGLMFLGFGLLAMGEVMPVLKLFFIDWIAAIIIAVPTILMIIRLESSKTTKMFEKKPMGKELMIFLRRDGTCEPMYSKRPYHGESFLEVPKVGLIHDLGKGCVYRWGDKNIRFALENVNHTPDPRFANYTSWLYEQGFDNMKNIDESINPEAEEKPDVEQIALFEAIPETKQPEEKLVEQIEERLDDIK